MMPVELKLEYPGERDGKKVVPQELYLAQDDDVSATRPLLTGDVLAGLPLSGADGQVRDRCVMIVQHPCSMRTDGVHLHWRVQAVEVRRAEQVLDKNHWRRNFHLMALPNLHDDGVDWIADFDDMYLLSPEQAMDAVRVTCLSQTGVNLLMQRLAHYQTRVVIPTFQLQEVTAPFFEETDLAEEWCDACVGVGLDSMTPEEARQAVEYSMTEFIVWVRSKDETGHMYQKLLSDPQSRGYVRRSMKQELQRRTRDATHGHELGDS